MNMHISFNEEKEARKELVQWGKELYNQGLVKGSGGNLSIRLSDGTVLLTPTGFFLGHMTEECISKCDMDGNLLEGNKPTKEVPLHLAVYKTRPNVNAVCHTHSVNAVVYASSHDPGEFMPICTPSMAAKVGRIEIKGYARPGSEELGQFVEEGLKKSNAVLLANHGVVAVGKNMEMAVSIANEVENNAILLTLAGDRMKPLKEADIAVLLKKVTL